MKCGKSTPFTPEPPDKIYYITLEAKAITEGFQDLAGAQIKLKGTTSSQITTINSGETIPYNAKDRGYMTEINCNDPRKSRHIFLNSEEELALLKKLASSEPI